MWWFILGWKQSKDDGHGGRESCERDLVGGDKRNYFNADGKSFSKRYTGTISDNFAGITNEAGRGRVNNESIVKFTKSEYLIAVFVSRPRDYVEQRVLFKTVERIMKNCNEYLKEMSKELERFWKRFVLICGDKNDKMQLWVAKVLFLFRAYGGGTLG